MNDLDLESNPQPYSKDDSSDSDVIHRTQSGKSINEPRRITYVLPYFYS